MTREDIDFIGAMNMCDEISNEAYKKIMVHCEEEQPCTDAISRQAVLNILDDMVREYIKENDFDKAQGVAWVKVQKLSSVSTEKKVNVLDKIRAEIEQKCCITVGRENNPAITLYDVFQIIDKYK